MTPAYQKKKPSWFYSQVQHSVYCQVKDGWLKNTSAEWQKIKKPKLQ